MNALRRTSSGITLRAGRQIRVLLLPNGRRRLLYLPATRETVAPPNHTFRRWLLAR